MLSDEALLSGAIVAAVVIQARSILLLGDLGNNLALTLAHLVLNLGGAGRMGAGRRNLAGTGLPIQGISASIAANAGAIIEVREWLRVLLARQLLLNDLRGVAG